MTHRPLPATPARRRAAALAACAAAALAVAALLPARAQAVGTSAAQQLQHWNGQAGMPGDAGRGRDLFTRRQGSEWSCASCHGNPPTARGRHAGTGKTLDPLAPAFNARAFTDTARTDKWFRRNCNDVLKRECSAGEKADVLAYLLSLHP
jgi:hypothetical protein